MPNASKPKPVSPAPVAAGPAAGQRRVSFSIPHTFGVDLAAGVLTGLQLMAAGREAKGHGIYIDEKTLTTAHDVAKTRGGRLKSYCTHDHAGPGSGTWWAESGSELDVCGFFSELSVKNGQLIAGRHEFYDSFKSDSKPRYDRIMEMANKTPDLLGLSVEVWGYAVYVGEDGNEYQQRPEGVELKYEGMPALRVTELWAAAFVSDGAATDGLFAKLGRKFGPRRGVLAKLLSALALETEEDEAAPPATPSPAPESSPANSAEKNTQHPGANNEPTPPDTASSAMKIIQDIKTRFGAQPSRLAAAMTALGNAADPAAITIDSIAFQVVEGELSAVRTELATANKNLADAEKARTDLATENATLKGQIEKLKGAGHTGVDLGAGGSAGGGAGVSSFNPWAKDSVNFTEQARILRTDPARAKALAAAAGQPDPTRAV